jgi:hypothetical protein
MFVKGVVMKSEENLILNIENNSNLTVNEIINNSGIMANYPMDEMVVLINAVSYLKDSVPLNILRKIRGSIASE